MILTRVLDHLVECRVASVAEIARAVDSDPDAVRSMLATLERRGLVHAVTIAAGCGSRCGRCLHGAAEVYGYGPMPRDNAPVDQCHAPDPE